MVKRRGEHGKKGKGFWKMKTLKIEYHPTTPSAVGIASRREGGILTYNLKPRGGMKLYYINRISKYREKISGGSKKWRMTGEDLASTDEGEDDEDTRSKMQTIKERR